MSEYIIALVENNSINRKTFLQKTDMLPGITLQFMAKNGNECLDLLNGNPLKPKPDVLFVDLEMPEMNGVETIRLGKALHPEIHFIVYTIFDEEEKIFEAIRAGASGYLLKHEPAEMIQQAIAQVMENGGAPMSAAIARKVLQFMSHLPAGAGGNHDKETSVFPQQITTREIEILDLMVKGWDAKKISAMLHISTLTVRKHIANIYIKLHVQSRAEVLHMAHYNKWFE